MALSRQQEPGEQRQVCREDRRRRMPRLARGVGAMIGLDTNVLERSIMQDDTRQSPNAARSIESLDAERPGFSTVVAGVEMHRILTS
jgi:hypothetical protein